MVDCTRYLLFVLRLEKEYTAYCMKKNHFERAHEDNKNMNIQYRV